MTPKEMQEQWLKKNNPEVCEDYIPSYVGKKQQSTYDTNKYIQDSSLKTLNQRRYEKREKQICKNCNDLFIPIKYKVFGRVKYSELCSKCSNTNAKTKELVRLFKGWDNYNILIEEYNFLMDYIVPINQIMDSELEQQLKARKRINEIIPNKNIQKGIKSLENRFDILNNTSITGYKFDF